MEWDVSREIFTIGFFTLRWYSLAFVFSFLLGFYISRDMYVSEKRPAEYVDDLFLYVFIGTLVGARLGHCLFYDPGYYLSHPIEIFKIWQGGLASHGAAIGILLALYYFVKKHKHVTYLWTVDRVVVVVALAGCFIRLGNLFNSEIYGKPTDVSWAFIFKSVDNIPRHPTQIYEAVAYLTVFILLYMLYKKPVIRAKQGYLFGLFLASVFGFRFFVEFFKENQVAWEGGLPLNMGQILSIPLVALGAWLMYRAVPIEDAVLKEPVAEQTKGKKKKKKSNNS
ncbi:MAG: prolipoprotein diacylglyceryl transferase [Calditrichia bacterium]